MDRALSFRLFGFPVRIEGSFLLVVGLLGYTSFAQLDRVLAFVVIAVVAVLIHELGHAFAARSQGTLGAPTISLIGMAGLTRYRLDDVPTRLQSMFISAAGPAAGVVTGLAVLALRRADLVDDTGLVHASFDIALFTTFGWSVFNLLPIVPLDGGHILTDLLPGSPATRHRTAAVVSIAVAGAIGVWLFVRFELLFGPLILGLIAFSNVSTLRRAKPPPSPHRLPPSPGGPPTGDGRGFGSPAE